MKEKLGFYRPAAAAFLAMMAMAVTSSTLSFFLEPVCSELGIGKGSFSLIFSLMTISGAATNPILGRIAGKKGVRGILAVTALWGCGSLLLFSVATQQVAMFSAMYEEYKLNPEITRSRMYYEAISQILPGVKLYINTGDGNNVDMLLPLDSIVGGGN